MVRLLAVLMAVSFAVVGCTKQGEESSMPETPPDEVVMQFFSLLSSGGKLTTKEALQSVSLRHRNLSPDTFRKWTQNLNPDSKISVIETIIRDEPNKNGDKIAVVQLSVKSPSMFGGDFETLSQMNLILDKTDNTWKIDFLADTIDEANFRKAPAKAGFNSEGEIASEGKKEK